MGGCVGGWNLPTPTPGCYQRLIIPAYTSKILSNRKLVKRHSCIQKQLTGILPLLKPVERHKENVREHGCSV